MRNFNSIFNALKQKYEHCKLISFRYIRCKLHYHFPENKIKDVIKINRKSLLLVDDWIDNDSFSTSCFNYGVPDFIKQVINKEINSEITYTDVLLYLSKTYFKNVNYLEIGVSVGKNFFQLINGVNENSVLTGFDIENINPILENKLHLEKSFLWDTPINSIKKNKSSLTSYNYLQNKIVYICGDVWDYTAWNRLSGIKYNLVFSDALHTPEAIQFEFEQLVKNKLLDEKFIILWDDLEGEMETAFYKIIKKYKKHFSIKEIYLLKVNGWVGEHEKNHQIGIISNFNF